MNKNSLLCSHYTKFFFICIFILQSQYCFSQYNFSGQIIDEEKSPIEFVNVLLLKDSIRIDQSITDSTGSFLFKNLDSGSYQLVVKYINLSTTHDVLLENDLNSSFEVKIIQSFGEVLVKGEKKIVVRKVDRTIFNVSDLPILEGSSAFEALEIAPGLIVMNEVVSLSNGKSIRVLIDGKLLPLTGDAMVSFIKSIPADNIASIEIIPVPPAMYDAKLTSGLVNIVLKKSMNLKLANGSIRGSYRQGHYDSYSLGANFNYQRNKFSLYTNGNFTYGSRLIQTDKTIDYTSSVLKDKSRNRNFENGLVGGIGMNFQLSPKTEFGLLYVLDHSFPESFLSNNMSIENNTTATNSSLFNTAKNSSRSNLHSFTISGSHVFDSLNKKVDLILDFSNYSNNNHLAFESRKISDLSDITSNVLNETMLGTQLFSGGLDFNFPYKHVTLTFGAKLAQSNIKNNFVVRNGFPPTQTIDSTFSNVFTFEEKIQAAYFSLEKKIKKWTLQLGLRGENTMTTGFSETTKETTEIDYFQLVPKLFAMYDPNDNLSFNLSYARNFYRPDFDQLNPFRVYQNPLSYFVGNPQLKPQIVHDFNFTSTFKNNLTIGLAHSYGKDISSLLYLFDSTTLVQKETYENFMKFQMSRLTVSYSFNKWKRYKLRPFFLLMYSNTVVDKVIESQSLSNMSCWIIFDNTFILDKKSTFFFTLDFFYSSPTFINIQRTVNRPFFSLTLRKTLLNERMQLSLEIKDPFRIDYTSVRFQSNNTLVNERSYNDSQAVRIGFSYNFGNNNVSVNEKSVGTTGESNRIGK